MGLAYYILPAINVTHYSLEIAHFVGIAIPVFTSYLGHKIVVQKLKDECSMKRHIPLFSFSLITLLYAGMMIYLESERDFVGTVAFDSAKLVLMLGMVLFSFLIRYVRWAWLLSRAGYSVNWTRGFVAYLCGFAYTATPGKVGELLRIRYFQDESVPHKVVISAFIYERSMDLIVVLALSSLSLVFLNYMELLLGFVVIVMTMLLLLVVNLRQMKKIAFSLRRRGLVRMSRLLRLFIKSIGHLAVWLTAVDVLVSLIMGAIAWSLVSLTFYLICVGLSIDGDLLELIGIYPIAMLAGAASMIPGGIGSTEVGIVSLLLSYGVASGSALTAAISVRVVTLWFAMLLGMVCVQYQEIIRRKRDALI